MQKKTKRIIFIFSLLVLAFVLIRTVIMNGVIKKTIIRIGASVDRTEGYRDYRDNCLTEKKNWTEEECNEISEMYKESPDNGYNRMLWEKSDYDCSDFDNWHFAQNFFQYTHSFNIDWYGLDKDRDGVVCEELWAEDVQKLLCNRDSVIVGCEEVLREQKQTKLQFKEFIEKHFGKEQE